MTSCTGVGILFIISFTIVTFFSFFAQKVISFSLRFHLFSRYNPSVIVTDVEASFFALQKPCILASKLPKRRIAASSFISGEKKNLRFRIPFSFLFK